MGVIVSKWNDVWYEPYVDAKSKVSQKALTLVLTLLGYKGYYNGIEMYFIKDGTNDVCTMYIFADNGDIFVEEHYVAMPT